MTGREADLELALPYLHAHRENSIMKQNTSPFNFQSFFDFFLEDISVLYGATDAHHLDFW